MGIGACCHKYPVSTTASLDKEICAHLGNIVCQITQYETLKLVHYPIQKNNNQRTKLLSIHYNFMKGK